MLVYQNLEYSKVIYTDIWVADLEICNHKGISIGPMCISSGHNVQSEFVMLFKDHDADAWELTENVKVNKRVCPVDIFLECVV